MGLTKIKAKQISNLDFKQAARVATVTNVTLAGGAPAVVDGISLNINNRVLVTGQTNKAQNGIYRVQILGTGSDGTWIRTTDADVTGEVLPGMVIMVTEGIIYADRPWKLTTNGAITIGVTELDFELFNGTVPGGGNTNVQFNDSGNFAGSADFTWDGTTLYINGGANATGTVTAAGFSGNGAGLSATFTDRGADSDNWNTLTQMGVYRINRESWSGTVGTPLDSMVFVGVLQVLTAGDAGSQVFFPGTVQPGDEKIQWNRNYWDGTWTAWTKIVNSGQVIDAGSY